MNKRKGLYLIISILVIGTFLVFSRADNTNSLYDAVAADSLTAAYNGQHQDSLDNSGTETIHYFAGSDAVNHNNAKLGDTCWQILRTTDTGGVKMIYNGPYDSTNKCNTSRGNHKGITGASRTNKTLSGGAYKYSNSFTYDESTGEFTLTNPITATWSDSTYTNLIGKYTCASTSNTCTTIYNVNSYYTNTQAYTSSYTIGDTHYSQIGTSIFNHGSIGTLAKAGYMFNTVYKSDSSSVSSWGTYEIQTTPFEQSDYDVTENDATYPFTWDSTNKTWESTMKVDSTSASIKFKVKTAGTYVLNYTVSSEANYDKAYFYKDGTELKNDSGSKSGSIVLENLTTSNVIQVKYSKDGSQASGNDNVVFSLGTQTGQATDNRYVFGNSFRYENGNYILQNTIKAEGSDDLSNNHYTCLSTSDTCSELKYIYYKSSSTAYYVTLTGGSKTITDMKNEMLYANDVNRYNSAIKGVIDAWYAQNMNNYTNYLEDAIYCNDRTEGNASSNGWNPNGGSLSTSFQFKDYSSNTVLKCNNVTDQFAVGNTKAKLAYPVGLATYSEMNLLGNNTARNTGQAYYLMSPYYLSSSTPSIRMINTSGSLSTSNSSIGIRPVISLEEGTTYSGGDGSTSDPYVVVTDPRPKIKTSVTNGTITESSRVESGSNKTINYSPNSGYQLKSIKVDGVDVSLSTYANSYTFTNITDNHTISVVYWKPTITTSVTNGTITSTSEVEFGSSKTISYSPTDSSCVLDSIEVDGVAVSTSTYANSYTFTNVTGDHTITVTYRQLTTANFDYGTNVNAKMKKLANNSSSMGYSTADTTIHAIKKANALPTGFTPSTENTVSLNSYSSQYPIYIFFDDTDGTMYYYSEADIVYLNGDSSYMFDNFTELTDISGLSAVDTSNVTDMSNMFLHCDDLVNINALSGWDTSGVTDMSNMFSNSSLTNINALSNWDTSSVTTMSYMFQNCSSLGDIDGASNWDISSVTSMSGMFAGCSSLTNIGALNNWDTSSVTSMSGMFSGCRNLTNINGASNWDTSSVTNISWLFTDCFNLEDIDGASNWDTSNVTNMGYVFYNCDLLEDIDALSDWDTSGVTNMTYMFRDCSSLEDIDGAADWDTSSVTSIENIFSGCKKASGTFPILGNPTTYSSAFSGAAKDSGAQITVVYDCVKTTNIDAIIATKTAGSNVVKGACTTEPADLLNGQTVNSKMKTLANGTSTSSGSSDYAITAIKRSNSLPSDFTPSTANTISTSASAYPVYIYFDDTDGTMYYYTEAAKLRLNSDSSSMFSRMQTLTDISGLSDMDASNVTNMGGMFRNCAIEDIDALTDWDTSSVTSMNGTFAECTSLVDIDGVSNWDTSKVTIMGGMFSDCKISNIDALSSWDTSNVTDMGQMFISCSSLVNIDGAANWDTSSVTSMSEMFRSSYRLANIDGAANWDTSRVTDMGLMFWHCSLLANIDGAANWDTSSVTDMGRMLSECSSLVNIDGASNWDTSSVTDITYIFADSGKASGTFPILGRPTSTSAAFFSAATASDSQITVIYDCTVTTNIDNIIATKSSNSHVVKGGCSNLRTMFDTGQNVNVKMKNLANNSSSMTYSSVDTAIHAIKKANSLPSGFTPSTENTVSLSTSEYPIYIYFDDSDGTMYYYSEDSDVYLNLNSSNMFYNFQGLTDISGLSSVDSSDLNNASSMFRNCSSLTNIDALEEWDVSGVSNMSNMFNGDSALADVDGASAWNTSSVTDMSSMFSGCTNASGTFPILGNPTTYGSTFTNTATATGAQVTVIYNCDKTTNIDRIIATKSSSSNVVKGSCVKSSYNITITNEIYGNMASISKDFTYSVEVRDENDVVDTALSGTFTLANDESEVLSLPEGYSITVTQDSETPYTTTVNDTNSRTITKTVTHNERITYKNTYDISVDTGISSILAPYILLVVLGVLITFGIVCVRKRLKLD
ncbi:MAG: BspA family leucine-rich repeat surface protein [Bacilli bacterium]|nr:BspA family leucine-rich repeat surface protein [Bacilli bacterium]